MKTKRFVKLNFYPICDVFAIILLVSISLFFCKIIELKHVVNVVALLFVSLAVQLNFGLSAVKNKSNKPIKAKPEDEDNDFLIDIEPQAKVFQIDGVKVCGKVYKIPDTVHVKVTKNNKIRTNSFISYMIYKGSELKQAPDSSWNKLFEA